MELVYISTMFLGASSALLAGLLIVCMSMLFVIGWRLIDGRSWTEVV